MPADKPSQQRELLVAAALHVPKLTGLSHELLQLAGVHISSDRQAVHLEKLRDLCLHLYTLLTGESSSAQVSTIPPEPVATV